MDQLAPICVALGKKPLPARADVGGCKSASGQPIRHFLRRGGGFCALRFMAALHEAFHTPEYGFRSRGKFCGFLASSPTTVEGWPLTVVILRRPLNPLTGRTATKGNKDVTMRG